MADTNNDHTLIDKIQELPPELFNAIRDYTLHATTPAQQEAILQWDEYHPPIELAISHHSRDLFATSYYSDTTFICPPCTGGHWLLVRWLRSLPAEHRRHIRRICLPRAAPTRRFEKTGIDEIGWLEDVQGEIEEEFGVDEPCARAEGLFVNVLVQRDTIFVIAAEDEEVEKVDGKEEDEEQEHGGEQEDQDEEDAAEDSEDDGCVEVWMSLKDIEDAWPDKSTSGRKVLLTRCHSSEVIRQ